MSPTFPICRAGLVALLLSFAGSSVFAGELSDRFDLHGFGFQDYAQSSDNQYLGADRRGTWDNNFLGLVMSATVDDRSKVWAQFEATTGEGAAVTWFFLDYQLSENLRAHAGRVKMPIGLYNEIIDAKFLQVAQIEPGIYQTATDFVHDAYHGIGLDYEQEAGKGHFLWQIYGGNAYDVDPPVDSRDRRLIGGRVTYRTPWRALRFMLSANRTQVEVLADNSMINEDRVFFSADLASYPYDFKAEYAIHHFMGVSSTGYYAQARYSLTEHWAPYIRYDDDVLDKDRRGDPSYYEKSVVIGIEYKIDENIGVRLENHFNHGYGLAVATDEVAAGTGKTNWNLTVAAVNFYF